MGKIQVLGGKLDLFFLPFKTDAVQRQDPSPLRLLWSRCFVLTIGSLQHRQPVYSFHSSKIQILHFLVNLGCLPNRYIVNFTVPVGNCLYLNKKNVDNYPRWDSIERKVGKSGGFYHQSGRIRYADGRISLFSGRQEPVDDPLTYSCRYHR